MIDRGRFFAAARAHPFGGTISQAQVDGCNAILDHWDGQSAETDRRWLAYMLATVFWETDRAMRPVEEYGHGEGRPYGTADPITGKIYDGRGDVQLTWKSNYAKMGAILGVDLVNHPELALDPEIAAAIMFIGMRDGDFTGVGLSRYFNAGTDDPLNARRIINGTDRAAEIAAIHADFLVALT